MPGNFTCSWPKNVNVVGSKKAELFAVNHLENGDTEVEVYRIKEKSGEIKFQTYDRVFRKSETREIRLYGLGDDDRFTVNGKSENAIKVRIIGGKGKDQINDKSKVGKSKTVVYDKVKNTSISSESGLKNKTSDTNEQVNEYNRYEFKYDKVIPMVAGGFNPDDGIIIGGGTTIIKNKFRKDPFGVKHVITGSLAPRSGFFLIKYKGHFVKAVGNMDLLVETDIFQPSFCRFLLWLWQSNKIR